MAMLGTKFVADMACAPWELYYFSRSEWSGTRLAPAEIVTYNKMRFVDFNDAEVSVYCFRIPPRAPAKKIRMYIERYTDLLNLTGVET